MRARRWLGFLLAVVVLQVMVLVADQPTSRLSQVDDERPRAIVALGDSSVSGEGAGDYLPGTRGANGNFCHRSPHAWINSVELAHDVEQINLACSGANAADVSFGGKEGTPQVSQATRLEQVADTYRVEAVTLAVGANDDPGFTDVLSLCIRAWAQRSGPSCEERIGPDWRDRIDAMVPKVERAVADVQEAMRRAGYEDDEYQFVLLSYPSPLSENAAPSLQDLSGCPFRPSDMRWLRTVAVPALSAGLREVAEARGIRFLDLSRAIEGHEACTHPDNPEQEWARRLSVRWELLQRPDSELAVLQESYHLTVQGHEAVAGCVSEFLVSQARRASCVPDDDGQVHPYPP